MPVYTQVQGGGAHTHKYKAGVHKFKAEVYKGRNSKTYFRVHTSPRLKCTHKSQAEVNKCKTEVYKRGEITNNTSAYTQVQG